MYLLGKNIETVSNKDIEQLVEIPVQESKILDFKKTFHIDSSEERKEFLSDISALANTEGGVIIYGIEEQQDEKGQNTGLAGNIVPFAVDNTDKLTQKIESILSDGLEPRLNTSAITFIEIESGLYVLAIGVVKSLGLPHMVTFKGSNKFYKRRNAGKYLLDVYELNHAFMRNLEISQIVEDFRKQRIQMVMEKQIFPSIKTDNACFLHVVPMGRTNESFIDLTNVDMHFLENSLKLITGSGKDCKFNVEGCYNEYGVTLESKYQIQSYTQLFRNGSIEFYTANLQYTDPPNYNDKKLIQGKMVEDAIIEGVMAALKILGSFQIEPPFAILLSMFDLQNTIIIKDYHKRLNSEIIGREKILFPAVVMNDHSKGAGSLMKSTFDLLWQAGDVRKSPYYTDEGNRYA